MKLPSRRKMNEWPLAAIAPSKVDCPDYCRKLKVRFRASCGRARYSILHCDGLHLYFRPKRQAGSLVHCAGGTILEEFAV